MSKVNRVSTTLTMPRRIAFSNIVLRSSRLIVFLVLFIAMAIASPAFFTMRNLLNILGQSIPIFLLVAGETLVMATGGVDLSLGVTGALSASFVAASLRHGNPIWLSIILGLAVGSFFGVINGLIVAKIRINPFITTFGTRLLILSLLNWYMRSSAIYDLPEPFRFLGIGRIGGIPAIIFVGLFIFAILYFLLNYTTFGRALYAIGSNSLASRISGIKVERILITVYAIAGIMSSAALMLIIARVNAADTRLYEGHELNAILGALLGGATFAGAVGTINGAVIGTLIFVLMRNAINLLGVSPLWSTFVSGIVVFLVVLMDEGVRRRVVIRRSSKH